jgi:hypothetical protein
MDKIIHLRFTMNELVAYASLAINIIAGISWILNRLSIGKLIAGRWEGVLYDTQTNDIAHNCTLIVTSHTKRINKALLYYYSTNNDKITIRGVDEMENYEKFGIVGLFKRRWQPIFRRRFHQIVDENGKTLNYTETKIYQWDCTIESIWGNPKINVKLTGNDISFTGTLHKS